MSSERNTDKYSLSTRRVSEFAQHQSVPGWGAVSRNKADKYVQPTARSKNVKQRTVFYSGDDISEVLVGVVFGQRRISRYLKNTPVRNTSAPVGISSTPDKTQPI